STLERMAAVAALPVVNLLSDVAHPMQALADVMTLQQEFQVLEGRTIAWIGDANNVCMSLTLAASMLGMNVRIAAPPRYGFTEAELDKLALGGATPELHTRPEAAAEGADAVFTDTWVSMGQEAESGARR